MGHGNIGIVFLFIGKSQWCLYHSQSILIGCSTPRQEYCKLIGSYWKSMRRQLWTLTCPIDLKNCIFCTDHGTSYVVFVLCFRIYLITLHSKFIFMATLLTLRMMPSFFCLTACFQIFWLRFCCRYHLQEYISRVSLTSTKKAMKVVNFCDQHGFTQQGNIILDFAWELLLIEFFFLTCLDIISEDVFHMETKNINNRKNKKKGKHVGRSYSMHLASVYLFTLI